MIDWSPPVPDKDKRGKRTGITSSDCFARNHTDRTVRRALKRWWADSPKRWVAWLMLNPHKASASEHDNTTRRLTHFTRSWDDGRYDGWIVVNVYPFVSKRPECAREKAEWQSKSPEDLVAMDDLQTNLDDIEEIGKMDGIELKMVAFGVDQVKEDRKRLDACLDRIGGKGQHGGGSKLFHCLEPATSEGQPRHTRGVPDGARYIEWERPN